MKKIVMFTQGGKGGVGKTSFAAMLIHSLRKTGLRVKVYDFDVENKENSGLQYYIEDAEKHNINDEGSLDKTTNIVNTDEYDIVVIDCQAAAGIQTFEWFEDVAQDAIDDGVKFVSMGIIDEDVSSLTSVLSWTNELKDSCDFLYVLNEKKQRKAPFLAYRKEKAVDLIKSAHNVHEIVFKHRIEEIENAMRNSGNTPYSVVAGAGKKYLAEPHVIRRCKGLVRDFEEQMEGVYEFLGIKFDDEKEGE